MKKKLCLLMALVCCVAVFAVAFVACNDNGGKSGGNGGGAGDVIFTEDASLEDIIAALENAESMTYSIEALEVGTYNGEDYQHKTAAQYRATREGYIYESSYTTVIGSETTYSNSYHEFVYRSEGMDYSILCNDEGFDSESSYKNFAQYDPDIHKGMLDNFVMDIADCVTTDQNGELVVTEDVLGDTFIEGTDYVKLNGSSIEIGWDKKYSDGEYDTTMKCKYVWGGVNATTIEIPSEIKALEAQTDWGDEVEYNGVIYQKAVDEQGEFYYIQHTYEGGIPEETINTLPVRERW